MIQRLIGAPARDFQLWLLGNTVESQPSIDWEQASRFLRPAADPDSKQCRITHKVSLFRYMSWTTAVAPRHQRFFHELATGQNRIAVPSRVTRREPWL